MFDIYLIENINEYVIIPRYIIAQVKYTIMLIFFSDFTLMLAGYLTSMISRIFVILTLRQIIGMVNTNIIEKKNIIFHQYRNDINYYLNFYGSFMRQGFICKPF